MCFQIRHAAVAMRVMNKDEELPLTEPVRHSQPEVEGSDGSEPSPM